MFASRLLKVLQTIPADLNYETCASDTPEPKLIMKEDRMEVLFLSNGYERGVDPMMFSTTDLCQKDGSETNADTLACGLANVDEFWNVGVTKNTEPIDDHPGNGVVQNGDVPLIDNQERSFWLPIDCHKGVESLGSTAKDNNEIHGSTELVPSMIVDEFTPSNEGKSTDSGAPSPPLPQLLEPEYSDKNVVEYELPELDIPDDFHIVKDICVDTGVAPQERTLIENNKDGHAASFTSQPTNEDLVHESINGNLDIEVSVPDRVEGSALEDTTTNSANKCGSWENFESVELDATKSSSEDNAGESGSKLFCTRNFPKMDEKSSCFFDGVVENVSEEESSISSSRVSEEFMMQDALLDSLKQEENEAAQQPDKIPSLETILESLAMVFPSKDSKKEDLMTKLSYNSKVEGGTITFDFKTSKPDLPRSKDANAETVDQKLSDASLDEKSKDQSTATLVERSSDVETADENGPSRQGGLIKEDVSSGSSRGPPQVQRVEGPQIQRVEGPQIQRIEGDSSFSMPEPVSGLVTYSGPIAYSGSTSLRSDSSTTSTRSFAFPVLQSEWNSSPVRMAKAEGRRTWKHRFWRHGFFCCRF